MLIKALIVSYETPKSILNVYKDNTNSVRNSATQGKLALTHCLIKKIVWIPEVMQTAKVTQI